MSKIKCVGLVKREHGGHREWIFEGTENMLEYPQYPTSSPKGIASFGTVKVKGHEDKICYKAGPAHRTRLAGAGWKRVGGGLYYDYVTQGVLK